MSFQQGFKREYEGLFKEDRGSELDTNNNKNRLLQEEYNEKWKWYRLIRELAKEDLTRFDEITNLNLYLVFNDLSYLKETQHHKQYLKETK